jgi:hypothetical protein
MHDRWLGPGPDPRELLFSYPPAPMTTCPISARVNSPDNDDPSLLNRAADVFDTMVDTDDDGTIDANEFKAGCNGGWVKG